MGPTILSTLAPIRPQIGRGLSDAIADRRWSVRAVTEELPVLPIHDMHTRHYGLTLGPAMSYLEAARVCLDRHHQPPTHINIRSGERDAVAAVHWQPADDRCRAAWANVTVTTEHAAYGCVIAACELTEGLLAVRRADIGTGADYYVAPPGTGIEDLEGCLRLEVSGVDHGSAAVVQARLHDKVQQTRDGSDNLPAMAGVVGFLTRLILLERVDELG